LPVHPGKIKLSRLRRRFRASIRADASVATGGPHQVPVAHGVLVPVDKCGAAGHAAFPGPPALDKHADKRSPLAGAAVQACPCSIAVPRESAAGFRATRWKTGVQRRCAPWKAPRNWSAPRLKDDGRVVPGPRAHERHGDWPLAVGACAAARRSGEAGVSGREQSGTTWLIPGAPSGDPATLS